MLVLYPRNTKQRQDHGIRLIHNALIGLIIGILGFAGKITPVFEYILRIRHWHLDSSQGIQQDDGALTQVHHDVVALV